MLRNRLKTTQLLACSLTFMIFLGEKKKKQSSSAWLVPCELTAVRPRILVQEQEGNTDKIVSQKRPKQCLKSQCLQVAITEPASRLFPL